MDGQNALDMILGPEVTQLLNESLSRKTPRVYHCVFIEHCRGDSTLDAG